MPIIPVKFSQQVDMDLTLNVLYETHQERKVGINGLNKYTEFILGMGEEEKGLNDEKGSFDQRDALWVHRNRASELLGRGLLT